MKPYIFPSSIETARALILHLVKLMLETGQDLLYRV